jgi:hypothetical protein
MQFNLDIQPTHKHTHLQAAQNRHTIQSLQKSVLLTNAIQTSEKGAAGNMGLASCGVTCLNSSSVFQINFSAGLTVLCPEIPHERQAQNR